MPTIYFSGRKLPDQLRQQLGQLGHHIIGPFEQGLAVGLATASENVESIEYIITVGTAPPSEVSPTVLKRLPNLKLVACLGSGYECLVPAIDFFRNSGIYATHSTDANSSCVADQCLALVLACTRRILQGDMFVRAHLWDNPTKAFVAPTLQIPRGLGELKIGILGLGTIGLKVAKRAAAFEMQVGYCNRRKRVDVNPEYEFFDSPLALAEWCDVFAVCLRADSSTFHIVDRAVLEAIGAAGFLVNISRGVAVDERALVQLLKERKLAGCGLDVFENEPVVDEELLGLGLETTGDLGPSVILAPHRGGWTSIARRNMCQAVVDNVQSVFLGQGPVSPIPELR
ncbi:hypothetical protein HK100_009318 [Physocladia obscura]|uniref:2-hydroxyacid dehydrogenase n=1 Tax=Physocladia obscura TaxID=109957 RepID=A0AAD5XF66_9FUNG|nr:hypothetical protein HK100_009318 [Physocladia obscura]